MSTLFMMKETICLNICLLLIIITGFRGATILLWIMYISVLNSNTAWYSSDNNWSSKTRKWWLLILVENYSSSQTVVELIGPTCRCWSAGGLSWRAWTGRSWIWSFAASSSCPLSQASASFTLRVWWIWGMSPFFWNIWWSSKGISKRIYWWKFYIVSIRFSSLGPSLLVIDLKVLDALCHGGMRVLQGRIIAQGTSGTGRGYCPEQ